MAAADFHPELRNVARFLPRASAGPRAFKLVRTLGALRSRLPAKGVEIRDAGGVSVRMHRPARNGKALPALLWIHGGGYVLGTAGQDDKICHYFADRLGITVAAVEYGLAPEHRFPVPLEDCYQALTWLACQDFVDGDRIAVGGASAGGGLAAALGLLANERGEVQLGGQVLAYPMLDDRTAARADLDESNFRLWNQKANRFGWEAYTGLPPGSSDVSGLASPARYDDLSGSPSTWMGTGTLDLFYDEDIAYSNRLKSAGVPCELQVVAGAFHGFDVVRSKAEVSKAFRRAQSTALAAMLHVD